MIWFLIRDSEGNTLDLSLCEDETVAQRRLTESFVHRKNGGYTLVDSTINAWRAVSPMGVMETGTINVVVPTFPS